MTSVSIDQDVLNGLSGQYKITGVDGKTQASTLIFTVPAGKTFYPTGIIISPSTVTTLVTPSVISVGSNGTDYNNIVATNALTGLVSAAGMMRMNPDVNAVTVAAGNGVYVKVGTGASAAAYTLTIILLGILI